MKTIFFLSLLSIAFLGVGCTCGDPGMSGTFDFRHPSSTVNIFAEDTAHYKADSTKIFALLENGQISGSGQSLFLMNKETPDNTIFGFNAEGSMHRFFIISWSYQNQDTIRIDVNLTRKNIFSCDETSLDLTYNQKVICTNCDPSNSHITHITKE